MKWETTKIFGWICLIVVAMIGLNNIDSLFSAFLQHEVYHTAMMGQSLLLSSAPHVMYHASLMMVIFSMLVMSLLYIHEIHRVIK